MLTWAIVTMFLRGMRFAKENKTAFRGDIGCLLVLTVLADVVITIAIAYLSLKFIH